MPASGPVNKRSSPKIWLMRVDFPAFGRPTTATCNGLLAVGARYASSASDSLISISVSAASSCARSLKSSANGIKHLSRSVIPSPCSADKRNGSPRPKAQASRTPASAAEPSPLLAPKITCFARFRRISANISSVWVTPTRASIINKQISAISTARSVKRRIRPCKLSSVTSSRPAVSITVKRRSARRASPSRKSRVTPG